MRVKTFKKQEMRSLLHVHGMTVMGREMMREIFGGTLATSGNMTTTSNNNSTSGGTGGVENAEDPPHDIVD